MLLKKVLIEFNNDIVSNLNKLGSNAVSFHTKENNIIEVTPEREELGLCRNSK
jgi:acetylglutamate kinase